MSGSGQFCPACGDSVTADTDDRPVHPADTTAATRRVRTLCDACYFERFDLVDAPDRVTVRICPRCGAVHRGNRWVDIGARDYTDAAIEAVQNELGVHVDADDVTWHVDPEQIDPNTIRMHTTFTGTVRDTPVEESRTVPVTIARGTCTRCGRIAGDYYAGVVQVRAADRTPTAAETDRAVDLATTIVADMEATGDRDAFITDITQGPDGVDIKVSTTKIGEQIARGLVEEFGGTVTTSETLVTEDEDGNEVYRVTFAVRLPPFTPGDVIDPGDGDGPVLVRSVRSNLKGRRLATGAPYEAPVDPTDAPAADRIGHRDDTEETTLVAIEDDHAIQVLDPDTYQPTTIPRPADLNPTRDTVRVLKSRAGLHVIPDD